MRWIWQPPDWPDFRYDKRVSEDWGSELRRLAGHFDALLPMASQDDVSIELMFSWAIKK